MNYYFKAGFYFYNQVTRKDEKTGIATVGDDYFFCKYYFNTESERVRTLTKIHNVLLESRFSGPLATKYENINAKQVVKNLLINEYKISGVNKQEQKIAEVYNTSAMQLTYFRLGELQKEVAIRDTEKALFIEACRWQLKQTGRLNPEDVESLLIIIQLKTYKNTRFNHLFLRSRIANSGQAKVVLQKVQLTENQIIARDIF